jgi:hypothetical protein
VLLDGKSQAPLTAWDLRDSSDKAQSDKAASASQKQTRNGSEDDLDSRQSATGDRYAHSMLIVLSTATAGHNISCNQESCAACSVSSCSMHQSLRVCVHAHPEVPVRVMLCSHTTARMQAVRSDAVLATC